jgi:hypothetical protein
MEAAALASLGYTGALNDAWDKYIKALGGFGISAKADYLSSTFYGNPVPFLFKASEPGAWYDPSDLTTMFQDSLGSTPVTTAGQTVGLLLDKSKNGVGTNGSSRRNLITFSEQIENAAWAKSNITVSANTTVAPNGASTAETFTAVVGLSNHRVISSTATLASGQSCVHSVYFKAGTYNFVQIHDGASASYFANFNLTSGTVTSSTGCTATITDAGSGWYRCSISMTLNAATQILGIALISAGSAARNESWLALGTETVFVWGAQIEASATATTYQPITSSWAATMAGNHATQATLAQRPTYQIDSSGKPYLLFDGVDDGMVTGTITPATDKAQVFIGVRKLSNAAFQSITELSASADANVGSFCLGAGTLNGDASRRTWASVLSGTNSGILGGAAIYAAPLTNVLSGIYDISLSTAATENIFRVNGVQQTLVISGASAGTGNFNAYPLYIGRRGGASSPFNGRLYSLIVRFGANLTTGQITSTETYVNGKTGAY